MHRAHERHVAPIGERRDHQTCRGTEVLVAIRVVALHHAHDHVLLAQVAPAAPVLHGGRVGRVLPVVAQLRDPLEVADRGAFAFNEPLDHVTRVHLDDDERRHDLVLQLVELGAHEEGELLELAEHLLVIVLHSLGACTVHVLLDAQSPVEGRDGDGGLRRVREHEGAALLHLVLAQSILDELAHREAHHLLDDAHPNLHRALGVDGRHEGDYLLLGRDHVGHRTVLALHRDGEDRLEALAKVRLHRVRVLGLREDRDQLVVRKEVEAREGRALRLEVVGEILLDALELVVRLDPLLEQLVVVAKGDDLGRLAHAVERLPPEPVHVREALRLGGQLALDVLRIKDGLQVHPVALAAQPLRGHLLDETQPALPVGNTFLEGSLVRREGELLREHDVVVEQRVHLLAELDDRGARVAVRHHLEVLRLPGSLHVVECLLDRILLERPLAHLLHALERLGLVKLHRVRRSAQRERVVHLHRHAQVCCERFPVAVTHARVA